MKSTKYFHFLAEVLSSFHRTLTNVLSPLMSLIEVVATVLRNEDEVVGMKNNMAAAVFCAASMKHKSYYRSSLHPQCRYHNQLNRWALTSLGEARQTDHNGGDVIAVVPFHLPPLGRRRLDQVLRRLCGAVWVKRRCISNFSTYCEKLASSFGLVFTYTNQPHFLHDWADVSSNGKVTPTRSVRVVFIVANVTSGTRVVRRKPQGPLASKVNC